MHFQVTSVSNPSGSNLNKGRVKLSAPRNGEPDMKTINGKPFKYNKEANLCNKRSEESATVISNVAAKVALDSKSKNNFEPAAWVASFSTIVLNGVQDALNKFNHWLLSKSSNCKGLLFLTLGFTVTKKNNQLETFTPFKCHLKSRKYTSVSSLWTGIQKKMSDDIETQEIIIQIL